MMNQILAKKVLAPQIYEILVEVPHIARKAEAGQFVIVRVREEGERIPLSIAGYDRSAGTISIVFQAVGKTTRFLAALQVGDRLVDILGPQGNPTEVEHFGQVVAVGGGVGVAPIYPLACSLKEAGNQLTIILGFRSRDYLFWLDRFQSLTNNLIITTDDGSFGRQGLVTDALKDLMARDRPDRVFAIGPVPMMAAVAEVTRPAAISTIVSLNSLMVCGMGMCGACRVMIAGKTRFTCMDGPDFDGHLVDFTELRQRLNTHRKEEDECAKEGCADAAATGFATD